MQTRKIQKFSGKLEWPEVLIYNPNALELDLEKSVTHVHRILAENYKTYSGVNASSIFLLDC